MSFLISFFMLMMLGSFIGAVMRIVFNLIGFSFRFFGYFLMIGIYLMLIKVFGAFLGTVGLIFIILIAIRSVWRIFVSLIRRVFFFIGL